MTEVASTSELLHLLLIEDNPGDASLVEEYSLCCQWSDLVLDVAHDLQSGLKKAGQFQYHAALLDLTLPDSVGLATFRSFQLAYPQLPVVLLTGVTDDGVARQAVRLGAQDYIPKAELTPDRLWRTIDFALARKRLLVSSEQVANTDALTGLYNRRGFNTISSAAMHSSIGRWVTVLVVDLDNMKRVNDTLGHARGDDCLLATAQVLRRAFREQDLIARTGGDEFVVLIVSEQAPVERYTERLNRIIDQFNRHESFEYSLSMSIGESTTVITSDFCLTSLIKQADEAMYRVKTARRSSDILTHAD
jgi:two-component system, cell cycle response regulator